MFNKSSTVAEMGDRFATIDTSRNDMGRKVWEGGCCSPFREGGTALLWISMPLGKEVDLGHGIVLDGDLASLSFLEGPNFRGVDISQQRLDRSPRNRRGDAY